MYAEISKQTSILLFFVFYLTCGHSHANLEKASHQNCQMPWHGTQQNVQMCQSPLLRKMTLALLNLHK